LATDEDIAAFLDAAQAEGDPAVVLAVLDDIARAQGVTQAAMRRREAADDEPNALPEPDPSAPLDVPGVTPATGVSQAGILAVLAETRGRDDETAGR
jgi:hypothetical protein